MANSTRKDRDASLSAWVLRVGPLVSVLRTLASEQIDQGKHEQDRFHLVKLAHPAINAQAAGPLTGTYKKLSKNLRANPHAVSRFLHDFQAYISTYLACYIVDTLCKPLFIHSVLHCPNTLRARLRGYSCAMEADSVTLALYLRSHFYRPPRWNPLERCLVPVIHSGTAPCFHPVQSRMERNRYSCRNRASGQAGFLRESRLRCRMHL
jgi:hypothetical protein